MKKIKRALFGATVMCLAASVLGALAGCENLPAPAEHVHNWGEWEITTPATCTADGVRTRVCADDSAHTQTDKVDKLDHDYSDEWTVDAAATCEEDGTKSHHCNDCDAKTDLTVIDATDHAWGEWKITKDASCTEAGSKTRTCATDQKHTQTEEIAAVGHTLTAHNAVPATCTENGVEAYWECSVCCNMYADEDCTVKIDAPVTVDATDHAWGEWKITKDVSCTEAGSKTRTCATDQKHTQTEEIAAVGHTLTAHNAVPATCTENGVEAYWECSVCRNIYADEDCTVNIDAPVPVEATDHAWGEWEVVTPATCTAAMVEQRVCAHNAEHNETKTTGEALGHNFDDGAVTKTATCAEEGVKTFTCTAEGCNHTKTEQIAKIAHNYQYAVTEGDVKHKVEFKCLNCGDKDESKTTYECDAAIYADEGAYTFSTTEDKSYCIQETFDKTYFVKSTVIGNGPAQLNYYTFVATEKGEYNFVFEHLTDKISVFAVAYNDTKVMFNRQIMASYKDVLTIKSVGAIASTNVTNVTIKVTENTVGTKFSIALRTLGASVDDPAIYLMTVSKTEVKELCYGENTVEITQANSFVDVYAFTPDQTKTYSLTAPKGMAVSVDGNDILDGTTDAETQTANFKATAGKVVLITFSNPQTGKYTVTVGEELYSIITPDAPLSGFTVPCKTVSDGVTSGGVAIAQVGDIEAGKYKLVITLNNSLMRSAFYFGKNINPDYNEIYGPMNQYGLGGTAEVIFNNMQVNVYNGADYTVSYASLKITVELDLQAGDKLVFAHSNTVNGAVSLTLTKV